MRALTTAIRTLTRLPFPGKDAERFADAFLFFPAVGLFLGALTCAVLAAIEYPSAWPLGAGIAGMLCGLWITRGLHVDGLADVADALGGGQTRERRLEIMKDPHCGAFGVMAIVADLLLKAAALSRLAGSSLLPLVILPFVISRTAQVLLACTLPYARPAGGKAAVFVEQATALHLGLTLAVALVFCGLLGGVTGLMLLGQGLLIALLLRLWMKHAFGGVTGDLLGFSNELIETGLLGFLALLAR